MNPMVASGINLSTIKIPDGSEVIDAILLDQNNNDLFINKVDLKGGTYRYVREGSIQNTKQGIIKVDDVKTGTWYLGLKNPGAMNGININIEVVALLEEKLQRSPEEEKAVLYGNLGWKAYERGEYDKCLELSKKALEIYPDLGYVWANMGLVQLVKNDYPSAIDSYANAIRLCKTSDNPTYYFTAIVKDMDDLIKAHGEL